MFPAVCISWKMLEKVEIEEEEGEEEEEEVEEEEGFADVIGSDASDWSLDEFAWEI